MTYPDYTPPTAAITVKMQYGVLDPVIPCTWEATGEFRPPAKGDWYLARDLQVLDWVSNFPSTYPRIILCRTKRIVFTYLRTGHVQPGEWYGTSLGGFHQWSAGGHTNGDNYKIYKRTEEE